MAEKKGFPDKDKMFPSEEMVEASSEKEPPPPYSPPEQPVGGPLPGYSQYPQPPAYMYGQPQQGYVVQQPGTVMQPAGQPVVYVMTGGSAHAQGANTTVVMTGNAGGTSPHTNPAVMISGNTAVPHSHTTVLLTGNTGVPQSSANTTVFLTGNTGVPQSSTNTTMVLTGNTNPQYQHPLQPQQSFNYSYPFNEKGLPPKK